MSSRADIEPILEPGVDAATAVRAFIIVVFKHGLLVMSIVVMAIIASLLASYFAPTVYQANASIMVKMGREHLNVPDLGSDNPVNGGRTKGSILNDELQILGSREVLEMVVKAVGVDALYPDLKKGGKGVPIDVAVSCFRGSLKMSSVRKTNVVELSFLHRDPRVAERALATLLNVFRERHLKVFSNPRSTFYEQQQDEHGRRYDEWSQKLADFKQRNGVYSLEEQRTLLLRQRAELDLQLRSSQSRIQALNRRLTTAKTHARLITESRDRGHPMSEREALVVAARSQLMALQQREQQLMAKYKEENPALLAVRAELITVQRFLKVQEDEAKEKDRYTGPAYRNTTEEVLKAEADLAAQQAKSEALGRQVAQVDSELRSLDLKEKDLQKLMLGLQMSEQYDRSYREKAEKARLQEEMDRSGFAAVSIIQPAASMPEPVSPRPARNLAMGVLLGTTAAISMAFMWENMSKTVSSPDVAEKKLGLPVLAVIPYRK